MAKHIEFSDHWSEAVDAVGSNPSREVRSPQQIIQEIARNYTEEERRGLVEYVGNTAISQMNQTYVTPFVKNAGTDALRFAVGLHELPEEQGDN